MYGPGTLTVSLAPLTATVTGTLDNGGSPVFTPSYSGFANGEDSSVVSGTLTCDTNATSTSPGGPGYTIDNCGGLSASNYIGLAGPVLARGQHEHPHPAQRRPQRQNHRHRRTHQHPRRRVERRPVTNHQPPNQPRRRSRPRQDSNLRPSDLKVTTNAGLLAVAEGD